MNKKVRRVYWLHHLIVEGKVVKKQTDFDPDREHSDCEDEIYAIHRHLSHRNYDATGASMDDFAEVISSTIMEVDREIEAPFVTPKHYGTDLLLKSTEWAQMEDHAKARGSKKKVRKMV